VTRHIARGGQLRLFPKVSIEDIVQQMLRASRWLWLHAEEHGMDQDRPLRRRPSAGGHLAAMMMCALWHGLNGLQKDSGRRASPFSGATTCDVVKVDYAARPALDDWHRPHAFSPA